MTDAEFDTILSDITPPELIGTDDLKQLCRADLHGLVRHTPNEAEQLIRSLAHTAIQHENSASIYREGIKARKADPVRYPAILAAERHLRWEEKLPEGRSPGRSL